MMQYTEEDIQAVSVANSINSVVLGAGEEDTVERRIALAYGFQRDEYPDNASFNTHVVAPKLTQYQRGKEVLKHAYIKTSTRFDATLGESSSARAELAGAVAPITRKFAGYTAQSQQVQYVTLMPRKKYP